MNKLIVKLPLMLGFVAAMAFATTPASWAAAKKHHKRAHTAAVAAVPPPAPAAGYPGSEFLKPPPKVAPIFPAPPAPH